jgi:superfamily I DNA/RNA helicase
MKLGELPNHQREQRESFTRRVIESSSSKKIIISGPGTGKTHIFKQVLNQTTDNCLVLTFINNLAEKLDNDLHSLARCCTFHSFCKSLLHKIEPKGINSNFTLYPKLELIAKSDAQMLLGESYSFNHCFRKLERSSKELHFFIERANYYNAVSFDDSVYRILEHFEKHPKDIPVYAQILLDEYQDFNLLEVSFIDILGARSPLLIVGDDDQALYGELRDASPEYIRKKYRDPQYDRFELPFCSRCTQVITDAIEDVISAAKMMNKLTNRVDKKFVCFLPDKSEDSEKYSAIIHAHCSVQSEKAPYLARFIKQEINKLTAKEIEESNKKADYTILITGPHHYLEQINSHLSDEIEWLIDYRKRENPESKKASIEEGYKILLDKDRFSNLGWRILLEQGNKKMVKKVLKEAQADEGRIYDYLPKTLARKHQSVLKLLEKMKTNLGFNKNDEKKLESIFKKDIDSLRSFFLKDVEKSKHEEDERKNRISVILTTYVGCKGISAGYVFAVGLNEGILPKNNQNPKDLEICQFIVILSRTVKKCYFLSVYSFAGKKAGAPSVFINWIDQERIRNETVDKSYWSKNT